MRADVGPPRLASVRDRELMNIGRQVANRVQARCRALGDDRNVSVGEAFPGRPCGIELEPGHAEIEVIGLRGYPDAVDALRHPLEQSNLDEPRQGAPGDTGSPSLLEGDEAPCPLPPGRRASLADPAALPRMSPGDEARQEPQCYEAVSREWPRRRGLVIRSVHQSADHFPHRAFCRPGVEPR